MDGTGWRTIIKNRAKKINKPGFLSMCASILLFIKEVCYGVHLLILKIYNELML